MASVAPLNIRQTEVAQNIDLTILENELLATPEPLYIFHDHVSTKYGPKVPNTGSKVQVNRLGTIESPDPDNLNAYIVGTTVGSISIAAGNLQALDWSDVTIHVYRRAMPKPIAAMLETMILSQVDIQTAHKIVLKRNYNEYCDDLVREAYRSAVCTNIYGNSLAANAASMVANAEIGTANYAGLGVKMLKEYKRRASKLNIRGIGMYPGSDKQALAGTYEAITGIEGINQLTEDPLWRDMAIRNGEDRPKLIKGWFGELEQVTVVKSERMRTVSGFGPSSGTFDVQEILFLASDPVLIDPSEGNVQGFVGEMPVVLARMGPPEVKRASEDNFGENLIYDWFDTLGIQALEEMLSAVATTLTARMGGNTNTAKGVAAVGSSRFVHRGYFYAG